MVSLAWPSTTNIIATALHPSNEGKYFLSKKAGKLNGWPSLLKVLCKNKLFNLLC